MQVLQNKYFCNSLEAILNGVGSLVFDLYGQDSHLIALLFIFGKKSSPKY
jgi:hypothetical protein